MPVILKNTQTTEYKSVEAGSQEFFELRAQIRGDGRPMWEQTGEHDLEAFRDRVESGQIRDTDVGDAAGPLRVDSEGDTSLVPGLDRGVPTPGEIEQGAGRAARGYEEENVDVVSATSADDSGQGFPAGHPPQRVDGETTEEQNADRLEEGLADDPLADADTSRPVETTVDHSRLSLGQLKQRVPEGVEVQRLDDEGNPVDGSPLKRDYIRVLQEQDNSTSGSEDDDKSYDDLGGETEA